ncbi:uncharacterized protein LOC110112467 [Dendrobium catenatum]|uniref:DUF7880 domain-containing protein n=1 Tax=Dendrobium catenatum TaxID=906689 RepID=A0A2I0WTP2_9ASPA|nr:uncharacterized protein LOC110112467 [Dendrobium catenatum]PKU79034.1 hypothetical protein MA16_Dca000378 [Dendrobium catenatum]
MASALQSARALSHGRTLRHFASQNLCLIRSHCRLVVICSSPSHSSLSTSRRPPPVGRRSAALAVLFLHCLSVSSKSAAAGSPFDKYVKRKKLEPLEAYVPAVLLTEEQFKDLEDSLDAEQPKYDISRSLLRSGPAASLRVNIRAVAQYADDDGKGKAASDAVDRCLRALEDLDSLLLHALRNDPTATIKSMKIKINVALESLDSLLQTVPASVLDKGKAIADSYRVPYLPTEEKKSEELDPELKKLEAIL